MKKIIIPGGSGFLGMGLARHFGASGYRVIILFVLPKRLEDEGFVFGFPRLEDAFGDLVG